MNGTNLEINPWLNSSFISYIAPEHNLSGNAPFNRSIFLYLFFWVIRFIPIFQLLSLSSIKKSYWWKENWKFAHISIEIAASTQVLLGNCPRYAIMNIPRWLIGHTYISYKHINYTYPIMWDRDVTKPYHLI